MTAVPRLYEVMRQKILVGLRRAGGLKRLRSPCLAQGRRASGHSRRLFGGADAEQRGERGRRREDGRRDVAARGHVDQRLRRLLQRHLVQAELHVAVAVLQVAVLVK